MSDKPKVYDKKPMVMEMEAGEYYWCACGRSAKQPFCDGSHKGTSLKPHKVTIKEKGKYPWCLCKATNSKPWCDGTHLKL